MNEKHKSCAPADNQPTSWDSIDWVKAEAAVRKLQARIVKAQKEGRHNKVRALQWTLTHSFYAKALAVKRVTSNGGGDTPGVDMETWEKPEDKSQAVSQLKRRGYQPKPLRRVHIKKKNGKMRPLGIPTLKIEQCRHCISWHWNQCQRQPQTHVHTVSERNVSAWTRYNNVTIFSEKAILPNGFWRGILKVALTTSVMIGFSPISLWIRQCLRNGSNVAISSRKRCSRPRRVLRKEE